MLDDPGVGGSVFAYASDDGAGNFDRFGFLSTPRSDSGRFLAVTDAASATTAPAIAAGPVRLPPGFTALAGTNYSPDGYPLRIRCEKDGAVMAYVSEGVFLQGKNGQDANAAPEHGVALDRFYIDIYEVTWENYEKYRDASRASKRLIAEPAVKPGDPAMPVTGISWAEARGYAVWSGRDLPSEAEWEKAARGTEGFDFPWGNGTYVWQRPRLPGQIDPVGSFPCDLSPLGVYDMAGNAREWCSDLYQSEYYARLVRESGATAHNPTGPKSSTGTNQRVVKGGSAQWHVWVRDGVTMNERAPDIGFRCVWHPTAGAKKR